MKSVGIFRMAADRTEGSVGRARARVRGCSEEAVKWPLLEMGRSSDPDSEIWGSSPIWSTDRIGRAREIPKTDFVYSPPKPFPSVYLSLQGHSASPTPTAISPLFFLI